MQQTVELNEAYKVEDAATSALLTVQRGSRYGSVPGLDEAELADPVELEREVVLQEWGPVLALPVKGRKSGIRPAVDESGGVDWGAFGTVDFSRTMADFDKIRYKKDKLKEQLKDLLIRIGLVKERLPGNAKYQIVKHLKMGVIGLDDIADSNMWVLARLYLRIQRLQEEIGWLGKASQARQMRQMEGLL